MRHHLLLLAPGPALGQDEAALRRHLKGTYVTPKIDMPASSEGVDVHPLADPPGSSRGSAPRQA